MSLYVLVGGSWHGYVRPIGDYDLCLKIIHRTAPFKPPHHVFKPRFEYYDRPKVEEPGRPILVLREDPCSER